MNETKRTCNVCSIEKPESEFAKRGGTAGGYKNLCKACDNKRKREERMRRNDKKKELPEKVPDDKGKEKENQEPSCVDKLCEFMLTLEEDISEIEESLPEALKKVKLIKYPPSDRLTLHIDTMIDYRSVFGAIQGWLIEFDPETIPDATAYTEIKDRAARTYTIVFHKMHSYDNLRELAKRTKRPENMIW